MRAYAILTVLLTKAVSANCPFPPENPGIFWSQEYVGADLLREKLQKRGVRTEEVAALIAIWDTEEDEHGEIASQLIAGPFPSALIPLDEPLDYFDLTAEGNYGTHNKDAFKRAYDRHSEHCQQNIFCPPYINNSMDWFGNMDVADVISTRNGGITAMVVSAGNSNAIMSETKERAAKTQNILTSGSLDSTGDPWFLSNFSPFIVTSVPSGTTQMSYDFSGSMREFGHTSGTPPFITASLATFTLLTGTRLSTEESAFLIRATNLPLPRLPAVNFASDGMLNAYKIGKVASRIEESCAGNEECTRTLLSEEETYNFRTEGRRLYEEGIAAFPECFGDSGRRVSSCEQTSGLKKLRAAALLDHSNINAWETIACVREHYFAHFGTTFYRAMSRRVVKSDADIIEDICQGRAQSRLVRYLPEKDLATIVGGNCTPAAVSKSIRALTHNARLIADPGKVVALALPRSEPRILIHTAIAIGFNAHRIPEATAWLRDILTNHGDNPNVLAAVAQGALFSNDYALLEEALARPEVNDSVLATVAMAIDIDLVANPDDVVDIILSQPKIGGSVLSYLVVLIGGNADKFADLQTILERILLIPLINLHGLSNTALIAASHTDRLSDTDTVLNAVFSHPLTDNTAALSLMAPRSRHRSPQSLGHRPLTHPHPRPPKGGCLRPRRCPTSTLPICRPDGGGYYLEAAADRPISMKRSN